MAVNRVPVLKRCRSLDLDPTYLGYPTEHRQEPVRRSASMVCSFVRNRKQNLSMVYLRNRSETITRKPKE